MVICSGNVIFEPETWKTGSGLMGLKSEGVSLPGLGITDVVARYIV